MIKFILEHLLHLNIRKVALPLEIVHVFLVVSLDKI